MGLINVEKHAEPETTLFPQETDLLLEILETMITRLLPHAITCGTFILDGQAYGDDAKLLLRGNFPGGVYQRQFFRIQERSSNDMATESIDEALNWPISTSRLSHHFEKNYRYIDERQFPESGIYRDGELIVLILNASHGRFLGSIKMETVAENDTELYDEPELLLYALAMSLAQMSKEDHVLQASVNSLSSWCSKLDYAGIATQVKELFVGCELPALKTWRDWHKSVSSSGKLTLFFE